MNRNARIFCFLVLALGGLAGCSSSPPANTAKKAAAAPDRIQGKAQVLIDANGGATDTALNAGGPSVYLWEGVRRYRLFMRNKVDVTHGAEYVAEGVYAQKAIDDIGDPDQGKNGYPLESSCARVIGMAWTGLPFDENDADASLVCASVKRYPARPLFLVTRLRPVTAEEGSAAAGEAKKDADEKNIHEVALTADKERASLIEGPAVQPAPLWEPAGGTVHCKVVINPQGKISELESGSQLCEAVPWAQFRYQPPVQGGHPVKVRTEVEVKFEPRK
jgi:hypothetical protein